MPTPPKTPWQDAFEYWTTGVVIAGADTRIEYVNTAFGTMVGRERSEIEGLSFLDLTHEEDRERNLALYNEVVDGARDGFVIEKRFVRSDGVALWSRVSVSALRAGGDEPARVVAVIEDHTERRDTEHQLARSEQRFRELAERLATTLESITDAFFTLDREWRFSYVNQEAERILEQPRDELIGAYIWDRFPEARGTESDVMYTRAMESGKAVHFDQFYPPLDRWFDVRAYPSAEGLAVYFRDVSDERHAAKLLRENSQRFQRVARATADAIWDWDLRTDAVWWSDGLQRTFGIAPADVAPDASSWTRRIHPDDHDRVVTGIHAVIDGGGESWEDRYRFRRGDGDYARVHDRGYIVRDDDGTPLRMVGGMSDETDRVEAERRVREQAELLAKAQDAIIVRELDQTITFWNPSAERLYGWSAEEAAGRRIEDLLYEDPEAFHTANSAVMEEGEWVGELEQVRKDGSKITVEGRWTLVHDEDGGPARILAINTDVTERKKLLGQFLRAQRLESIGTLAGGIAHDLNNVLAPILLSIEMLKLDANDPETVETLESIEDSARRGADMVRQVLSFARGVEGARVPVDVQRLVHDLGRVVRDTFPKDIRFQTDLPEDAWRLLGDPTQIHQVLLNLFVNARDAMPDGGTLSVSAENVVIDKHYSELSGQADPGPHVRISVNDTGTGIPQDVLEQIFDPFFTTKEVGKGTGLGLSTVSAIVRGHGGFVNVYSETGQGTSFRIYLPAGDGSEAAGSRLEPEELPRGHGELILVVDDEASVRDVTRQTLEAFDYRVLTATDGADAVALYGKRGDDIDVVLTDLMMPIMDGPTLIRVLRRMDPDVRIVAASGIGTDGGVVRAADSGVRDFLPKPYTAGTLLQVLAQALGTNV